MDAHRACLSEEGYHLSKALDRAIAEVLDYKKQYEECQTEELARMGINRKMPVSKCVIVIGKRLDSVLWRENSDRIRQSLNGIEHLTYHDLIDRLENSIANLERHVTSL